MPTKCSLSSRIIYTHTLYRVSFTWSFMSRSDKRRAPGAIYWEPHQNLFLRVFMIQQVSLTTSWSGTKDECDDWASTRLEKCRPRMLKVRTTVDWLQASFGCRRALPQPQDFQARWVTFTRNFMSWYFTATSARHSSSDIYPILGITVWQALPWGSRADCLFLFCCFLPCANNSIEEWI